MYFSSRIKFNQYSDLLVIHLDFIEKLANQLVLPGPLARFVGVAKSGNDVDLFCDFCGQF